MYLRLSVQKKNRRTVRTKNRRVTKKKNVLDFVSRSSRVTLTRRSKKIFVEFFRKEFR